MDPVTIRAFSDELQKIASDEKGEANKLFGLPLTKTPSGTQSYELKQMKDEEHAMEQEAIAQEEAAAQQEAMAAAAPAPAEKKPAEGEKKKPEKKDSKGGDQKVKVEVKVNGGDKVEKPSKPSKPSKPKKPE